MYFEALSMELKEIGFVTELSLSLYIGQDHVVLDFFSPSLVFMQFLFY